MDEQNSTAGQSGTVKRLCCEWCQAEFTPRNKNKIQARFCSNACRLRWNNKFRLQLVAAARAKAQKKSKAKLLTDNRITQRIALELIPAAERPALLAEAANRLGLVESPVLTAARRVRRICDQTLAQGRPSPFKSATQIQALILQSTTPDSRLKLEAMLGVIEAAHAAAARRPSISAEVSA